MKANFIFLVLSAIFMVSCASSDRNPASVEQKKDTAHQQFQGYFDRPDH